jgi:hypothetical protein
MGTPDYMSPEQIVDPKRVDSRSDVYSFGCVLYAMFTGETPFSYEGATAFHVQTGHVRSVPPPLIHRNPEVPPSFGAVVLKCLEKNPADRYSTCGAVMSAFEQLLLEKRATKVEDAPTVFPTWDEKKERPQVAEQTSSFVNTTTVSDPKLKRAATQEITQPYRVSEPRPNLAPDAPSPRASTVFISATTPSPDQALAANAKTPGNSGKYFLLVGVFVMLIAGAGYFLLHAKTGGQASTDRLQQLRSKDWPHARYDDPDFSDCMGVQACLDSKERASRLKEISDWKSLRYDDQRLQHCMGLPQCTEQAEHAAVLQKTANWARADNGLLSDCMEYEPCTSARRKSAGTASATMPAATPATGPQRIKGRSVEDLPSCCSKDSNPSQCVALKKQADLADCSSPIGDN